MKRKGTLLFSAALVPALAYADGGGPLLLIINFFLFSVGQFWILLAEYLYLQRIWPKQKKMLVFTWTFFANLISTLLGALLLPFLWAAVFGILASIPGISDSALAKVFWAMGTWIIGDNTPYPWLTYTFCGILFILTYFLTVFIEYKLLQSFTKQQIVNITPITLRHCFMLNLISYCGLVVLFILGTWLG